MATEPKSSWILEGDANPLTNPLVGLRAAIATDPELRADVLLCPGDLCDKADASALQWMWEELEEIRRDLGADRVISTAGNHDIDGQGKQGVDPVELELRNLAPPFPSRSVGEAAEYWDARVSLVVGDEWQVATLNTTLMRLLEKDEEDHGEVHDATLQALDEITKGTDKAVNLLLCHHHPHPFRRFDPSDRSHMLNGDQLVRRLDESADSWMIVHGHKHEPFLNILEGSASSPIRLASGSVGANLFPTLATNVRNQFHIIAFDLAGMASHYLSLAGRVLSWTWGYRTPWHRALDGDGLPAVAGFGYRNDGKAIADALVGWARATGREVVERDELLGHDPKIPYLLPQNVQELKGRLTTRHDCHLSFDTEGRIDRVILP